MRINNALRQYFTGRIDDRQLAAGTVSRIQTKHHFAFQRRLQQQVAQVVAEDVDRLRIGGFGQFVAQFAFDGRSNETAVAVFIGGLHVRRSDTVRILQNFLRQIREDFLLIDRDRNLQDAGFFAAVHSQDAVRYGRGHTLGKIVVHLEDALFVALGILHRADDLAVFARELADMFAVSRFIADDFGDDFMGPSQNVFYSRKFHFLVQEFLGLRLY